MGSRLPRSLLFAPGSRPDLLVKATRSGADAVICDLEDSVAGQAKQEARANVARWLEEATSCRCYLRVNHPDAGDTVADLASPMRAFEGVLLPKAEGASVVEKVAALAAATEARIGMREGSLVLVPMIESCLGVRNAFDIAAASPRVRGIALATAEEGDLMADLGGRWTAGGEAMSYARGRVVCEARAAGLEWLIDGVFMQLDDEAALRQECELARTLGYTSKLAIHPRQLAAIHETFTPSAVEVAHARALIEAFRAAEARGEGAVRFEGRMVDYANVRVAERVLARAATPVDTGALPGR